MPVQDDLHLDYLEAQLRRTVEDRLADGWTRADLAHVVARHPSKFAKELLAAVNADGGLGSWTRRRGLNQFVAMRVAKSVVDLLEGLKKVPGSGQRRSEAEPAIVAKVRALLTKAESTTFPAEAEALTAKAHELMTRHAIDQAMVAGPSTDGEITVRRVLVEDPYARPRFKLLSAIAVASGCRAVLWTNLGLATVFGTADDVRSVEMLYASLLVQAAAGMTLASQGDFGGASRKAAFRRAYLHGFAHRIGDRLHVARDHAVDEAKSEHGDALLPVLASRVEAVDAAVDKLAPGTKPMRDRISSASGWTAGDQDARRATVITDPRLASRRGLPA